MKSKPLIFSADLIFRSVLCFCSLLLWLLLFRIRIAIWIFFFHHWKNALCFLLSMYFIPDYNLMICSILQILFNYEFFGRFIKNNVNIICIWEENFSAKKILRSIPLRRCIKFRLWMILVRRICHEFCRLINNFADHREACRIENIFLQNLLTHNQLCSSLLEFHHF